MCTMTANTGYDNFAQRLADTFAGLDDASTSAKAKAPAWQPSQQQVTCFGFGH